MERKGKEWDLAERLLEEKLKFSQRIAEINQWNAKCVPEREVVATQAAHLISSNFPFLFDSDASNSSLSYPNGISLLSLKTDVLLSYIHHLVLLVSHRARGFSLAVSPGRDLVANLVRNRLVLEKVKPLHGRLRYQIEKLNKALAEEEKEKRRGVDVGEEAEGEEQDEKEDKNELGEYDLRSETFGSLH